MPPLLPLLSERNPLQVLSSVEGTNSPFCPTGTTAEEWMWMTSWMFKTSSPRRLSIEAELVTGLKMVEKNTGTTVTVDLETSVRPWVKQFIFSVPYLYNEGDWTKLVTLNLFSHRATKGMETREGWCSQGNTSRDHQWLHPFSRHLSPQNKEHWNASEWMINE